MARQVIQHGVDTRLLGTRDTWVRHNAGRPSWVEITEEGHLVLGHPADWRVYQRPAQDVRLPRHVTLGLVFLEPPELEPAL
jgi:hypothetical protein